MGGEVSLHRTLVALHGTRHALTRCDTPYTIDGVSVSQINTPDVLDVNADPAPIAEQLAELNADVVIGQNELSLPAVRAARQIGAVSVVNVHTPPRYGRAVRQAVIEADHAIYNTSNAARLWGEPNGMVLHPPVTPLPPKQRLSGKAYTLLSNLSNKGVTVALELAARMPDQRFIIVRSPAEVTHGLENFDQLAAALPNVEVHPRVAPGEVAERYLTQTRILLAPSRYETYGMSAIEAAGYGIPSVHVDTPDVREGIGTAAELIRPLNTDDAHAAIKRIEADYTAHSERALARAEHIAVRQTTELTAIADDIESLRTPTNAERRRRSTRITAATARWRR